MSFDDILPDYLRGDAVAGVTLVGPRTYVSVSDPAGSPQSLALSTTIQGTARIDSGASNPAFTTPGSDIQVASDEAILIEALTFRLIARDASGKLQFGNLSFIDSFGPLPFAPNPTVLPYTFAGINGDALNASVLVTPRNPYIRNTGSVAGSFAYNISAVYILTNTDGAGAHTYTRQISVIYRRIQGLAPLVPRVYNAPR